MAVLNPRFLSHGTLETRDLERAKQFYKDFLGLDVIQTSDRSLMIRLGGQHVYAVVLNPKKPEMAVLNHNGLDVPSRAEVDNAHAIAVAEQERWGIKKVTRPVDAHGTYGFYIADPDDNWWEILTNPDGGYTWMFSKGDDIDSWGAGEEAGYNPNDFTRKRPAKKKTSAS